jgi:hypothetical protein
MFELLKRLVETVLKGFSFDKLAEKRREKRLAEVGTEILLLYTSINEILVVGEMITSELESALGWLDRKKQSGEIDRHCSTHLDFLLPQQGNNILKFQASLKRLALQLQVVAPEVYSQIAPLMHGKGNALARLVDSLVGNYGQAVGLPTADMQQLSQALAAGLSETAVPLQPGERPLFSELQRELAKYVSTVNLPNLGSVGQDAAPVIRNYLEQENPRARLKEIKDLLVKLREGIETTFSLQDILLEVGDRRVANDDPWVGF